MHSKRSLICDPTMCYLMYDVSARNYISRVSPFLIRVTAHATEPPNYRRCQFRVDSFVGVSNSFLGYSRDLPESTKIRNQSKSVFGRVNSFS